MRRRDSITKVPNTDLVKIPTINLTNKTNSCKSLGIPVTQKAHTHTSERARFLPPANPKTRTKLDHSLAVKPQTLTPNTNHHLQDNPPQDPPASIISQICHTAAHQTTTDTSPLAPLTKMTTELRIQQRSVLSAQDIVTFISRMRKMSGISRSQWWKMRGGKVSMIATLSEKGKHLCQDKLPSPIHVNHTIGSRESLLQTYPTNFADQHSCEIRIHQVKSPELLFRTGLEPRHRLEK